MNLQLRRVMLFVKDVDAVADFYVQKLGLRVVHREPGFADLDAGGARLALHRSGNPTPGSTKLCFYTPDVSATRTALIAAGVEMGKDPGPGEGLRLCDGKDPAGNTFQLSTRE